MENDVYTTVPDCRKITCNPGKRSQMRHPKLIVACSSLEFIAMPVLTRLLKTRSGNQFVVTVTYQYSKLTGAVPFLKKA